MREPLDMAEADQAADPRATVLLPDQLLQGGELIILLIKPSPWYIVLESLRFLAITFLLLALAVLATRNSLVDSITGYSSVELASLAVFVVFVRLVWQCMEWISRVYVLTDRRVIRVRGVFRVQVFETQLKQVQHTVTLFSIRERVFGLGTIGFATAGTGQIEAMWRMVANPLDVHRLVIDAINRYQ